MSGAIAEVNAVNIVVPRSPLLEEQHQKKEQLQDGLSPENNVGNPDQEEKHSYPITKAKLRSVLEAVQKQVIGKNAADSKGTPAFSASHLASLIPFMDSFLASVLKIDKNVKEQSESLNEKTSDASISKQDQQAIKQSLTDTDSLSPASNFVKNPVKEYIEANFTQNKCAIANNQQIDEHIFAAFNPSSSSSVVSILDEIFNDAVVVDGEEAKGQKFSEDLDKLIQALNPGVYREKLPFFSEACRIVRSLEGPSLEKMFADTKNDLSEIKKISSEVGAFGPEAYDISSPDFLPLMEKLGEMQEPFEHITARVKVLNTLKDKLQENHVSNANYRMIRRVVGFFAGIAVSALALSYTLPVLPFAAVVGLIQLLFELKDFWNKKYIKKWGEFIESLSDIETHNPIQEGNVMTSVPSGGNKTLPQSPPPRFSLPVALGQVATKLNSLEKATAEAETRREIEHKERIAKLDETIARMERMMEANKVDKTA